MADDEELPNPVHFLKKPLFFWTKSFAENEIQREDSFSKFLTSDALNYALEYIGIPTECEQSSSLHLSSIFDEDGNQSAGAQSTSLTSNSSRSKYSTNQYENELKQRISKFNLIFNELRSYYEDHFSQLLLQRPPNSVHITMACTQCGISEYEKILLLLLGAAIQGNQKQETIRRIRIFPTHVQEQLIESIKQITNDNPEVYSVKPWSEVSTFSDEEKQKVYDNLLSHLRRLIYERNDAVQTHLNAEYNCGLTNCEQRRLYESRGNESLDFEKYSEDNRSSAAMRQLREELLEKSDLLKECREELEMTTAKLYTLQHELSETQQQLRTFKKTRDECDVLREGQEKALRLEAELLKMKKKLEESEQYYERVEILQNENRTYQRKHAILMDQINMLTVEKERLEMSFMTQQSHLRSPRPFSESEDEYRLSFSHTPRKIHTFPEELLLESDIEKQEKVIQEVDNVEQNDQVQNEEEVVNNDTSSIPAPILTEEVSEVKTRLEENALLPPIITSSLPKYKDAETQNIMEDSDDTPPTSKSTKDKRRSVSKRGHRRSVGLNGKRTRKSSLFPNPKVILQKANNLSTEKLDEVALYQQHLLSETNSPDPSNGKKNSRRKHSRGHHQNKSHTRGETRRGATPISRLGSLNPNSHNESDADEELSLSPKPTFHRNCSSSSDVEPTRIHIPTNNHEIPSPYHLHNPPPHPMSSDLECENEVFFVCSTIVPSPRNIRIYAPSRDYGNDSMNTSLRQSDFIYSRQSPNHHQQQPEGLSESPILQRRSERHIESPEISGSPQSPTTTTRCSIQVNLRHVNANSHQFSLLEPQHEAYVQQNVLRPKPPIGNKNGTYSSTFAINQINNPGSSSDENDDSVWYEYGCV